MIGTSTDTTFSEILTAFGAYSYKVTALWEEGESDYSNTKTFIHSAVVPTGLATVFDSVTATVDLSWTFDNSKAFQHFNIYRNDVLTGISTDTLYTDVLPDFGVYDYKVTSLYDEGESGYSNVETILDSEVLKRDPNLRSISDDFVVPKEPLGAMALTIASLIGKWDESNENDRELIRRLADGF